MPVRFLVSLTILLAAFLMLFLVLLVTDTALSVWNYLMVAPAWVQVSYALILAGLPLFTIVFFWRWFRPAKKPVRRGPDPPDAERLQQEVLESSQQGVNVSAALAEIREQRRRRAGGEVYLAIYGEVSSGKSSLVKALLPEAEVTTDPRAGSTAEIRRFNWRAASGDRVVISDLPGFNLRDDTPAREEARRAHLVIFLCEGDLSGSEATQVQYLKKFGKPLLLALNKMDRYSETEREALLDGIRRKTGVDRADIVPIRTGGREEVVRLLGEGIEERSDRPRSPEIDALRQAVQRHLDRDRELMESLRETAVLSLAGEKLSAARDRHRQEQAEELVGKYSRRAVVGALAAVAPGSDLVIQGLLATQLMKELSRLYDVPVKELEIESFLKLAGGKIKNMTAITLAIAGNALKAFPGVGTVSGGLVHAVAYGMIFDSLGRAAAQTMASRGQLRPYPAAEAFEDLLNDHLEAGAVRFAKLAITRRKREKNAS
ncbi:MAG: GTPase [Xanthomonadales bacterium]|nr:GTPase [Xanthomonadales bacterium]